MWNFKLKNKVAVNSNKGDTIKNSQIIMNDNSTNILSEVYRAIGRLEGNVKCMSKDISYIKSKFEDLDDRITKMELFTSVDYKQHKK